MAEYTIFGPAGRFGAEPHYFTKPGSLPELTCWDLYDVENPKAERDPIHGPIRMLIGRRSYFLEVCELAADVLKREGGSARDVELTAAGKRFAQDFEP